MRTVSSRLSIENYQSMQEKKTVAATEPAKKEIHSQQSTSNIHAPAATQPIMIENAEVIGRDSPEHLLAMHTNGVNLCIELH